MYQAPVGRIPSEEERMTYEVWRTTHGRGWVRVSSHRSRRWARLLAWAQTSRGFTFEVREADCFHPTATADGECGVCGAEIYTPGPPERAHPDDSIVYGRRWREERDRYREALEDIADDLGHPGDAAWRRAMEALGKDADAAERAWHD